MGGLMTAVEIELQLAQNHSQALEKISLFQQEARVLSTYNIQCFCQLICTYIPVLDEPVVLAIGRTVASHQHCMVHTGPGTPGRIVDSSIIELWRKIPDVVSFMSTMQLVTLEEI